MIETIIRALKARMMSMIGKAIVYAVDDVSDLQLIKMSMLKDEVRSNVERVQPYGFSGNPPIKSEAVYFSIGGNKDNCIILNIDSAKYRIKGLESGEVAVYSMFNGENNEHSIILKKDKTIEINGDKLELGYKDNLQKSILGEDLKIYLDSFFNEVFGAWTPTGTLADSTTLATLYSTWSASHSLDDYLSTRNRNQ